MNNAGDKPVVTQEEDIFAFIRECVETARSDCEGYHLSNKPGEPDLSRYDAAMTWIARFEQDTLSREGRETPLGLEWTEDGYSLRTPYDGDVDADGRHIIVGGEIAVTFADSDEGEKAREAFIAALSPPASEGSDVGREAALVAAVRDVLSSLGQPTGYFPEIGAPLTRSLQRAFESYEPHPAHKRHY